LPALPASEASRLPVQAIPVMAMEHALPLLIAAVPLLSTSRLAPYVALVPLAIALIGPVIRYLRFRYTISSDLLVLEGGLLFRWRREIPFARIQSVDFVQKLRHQILGVVELRIEVVGGRATEASFPALKPEEAERIRSIVLEAERGAAPDEKAPHLARMMPRDLLLAGATGGRVAVVALALGYLQELLPEEVAANVFERLSRSSLVAIAAVAATFLLMSVILSLLATVVVYWDFTVSRDPQRLIITRGLLERRRALLPLNRVQAFRVIANPVRRLLGFVTVSAVLAGYAGEKQEGQETSMVLPIARSRDAFAIVGRLLGLNTDLTALELETLHRRALTRRCVYAVVGGVLLGAGGIALFGARGAVGLLVVPLGAVWSWLAWRGVGHAVVDQHLVVRSGALSRRYYVVPVANVQHLELMSSPLQRPLDLATLRFRIPKATPKVSDLERVRADEGFAALVKMLVP
jgi:putative membrane protein